MDYATEYTSMRAFFSSGATQGYDFRISQLKKLRDGVRRYEKDIYEALYLDLRKSAEESYVTENGFVLGEINTAIKHLNTWMKPDKVSTNLANWPSKSYVLPQPLGCVLIIGPWNYPFHLIMAPLVGAIAAGNCVVIKPSELAPKTEFLLKKLIAEIFPPDYIRMYEGSGAEIIPQVMEAYSFDHIFFTGGTRVGKLIYQQAAKKLIPVTLELGGKSPCIVESDAEIIVAAKRITVTKFANAGQTCVAPDYILVHRSKYNMLVNEIIGCIDKFYGESSVSGSYGRIINEGHFNHVMKFVNKGTLLHGGQSDKNQLFISPTLIAIDKSDVNSIADEIFGPILPVITFDSREEALNVVNTFPDPLAFYLFTKSKENENYWFTKVRFGGGCINNAAWHLTNPGLPFGGVGSSGTGNYHGKFSFFTFSHMRSILKTPLWPDPSIKYPPLTGKLKWYKKLIGK